MMIVELARFSLGRVLLHLISMLGDGAVRFHAAGIMRELSWVAEATALVSESERAGNKQRASAARGGSPIP
jgi:hypothetical protein